VMRRGPTSLLPTHENQIAIWNYHTGVQHAMYVDATASPPRVINCSRVQVCMAMSWCAMFVLMAMPWCACHAWPCCAALPRVLHAAQDALHSTTNVVGFDARLGALVAARCIARHRRSAVYSALEVPFVRPPCASWGPD